MLLTSFSKHSVVIPRGQSVSAVTGGVEYFREDRQHMACDNSEPKLTIINESNIDNMNYLWKLTINASENVLLFTEY